jgi:signal peptidase I
MSVIDPPAPPAAPASAVRPMEPRSGSAAAVLTFLAPGVGHVYAGNARRGIVAALVALVVGVAGVARSMAAGTPALRIASLSLAPLAVLAIIVDAWRTARDADPDRPPRRYQRAWVYVTLVLLPAFTIQPLLADALLARWRAFHIPGGAMSPTIRDGDYVMAARRGVRIQRNTVITYAMQEGGEAVSRIVAVGGDTVSMRDGVLTVNGTAEPGRVPVPGTYDASLDADWQRAHLVGDTAGYAPTLLTWGPLVVPAEHVFLVGDNRARSLDSRHLGFIPAADVTGRPVWIYFSREPLTGGIRWRRIGRSIQ